MAKIKRKIHVIGINSYEFKELPLKIQTLFIRIKNIAVPDSYISYIKFWAEKHEQNKLFFASKSNENLIKWIKSQKDDVIVISRGDPLWFGIGRLLLENFSKEEINFHPANTCIQLAFSKLKIPWQETSVVSIHGRDSTKLIQALKARPSSLAIVTDSQNKGVKIIQQNLLELDLTDFYDLLLCEDIGFKDEKIRKLNLKEPLPTDISSLNIAVLIRKQNIDNTRDIPLFGIRDDIFKTYEDRPNLLTKREIRIQVLADLELPKNGAIWDIGAGCGSIGLEALKLRPNLELFCIDKRIGSKKLIAENARRLGVKPTIILEEDINNLFNSNHGDSLKRARRIIIGGCDKKTKIQLIDFVSKNMQTGDIIIIPLIDIESIREIKEEFEKNCLESSMNLVQTYKSLSISKGIRLDPNNPVFLLKGKKL